MYTYLRIHIYIYICIYIYTRRVPLARWPPPGTYSDLYGYMHIYIVLLVHKSTYIYVFIWKCRKGAYEKAWLTEYARLPVSGLFTTA